MSRQPNMNRLNRVAQMSKQEEIIEKKKREILEKQQKAVELAKLSVATTKASTSNEFKNNFNNDGSFMEQFKRLSQKAETAERLEPATNGSTEQVLSDDKQIPLPTTVDQLVDLIAEKGDAFESFLRRFNKSDFQHTELWFLFDKDSKEYLAYRDRVMAARGGTTTGQDKYDPEEALEQQPTTTQPNVAENSNTKTEIPSINSINYDDDDTEDSDTEYRREAKERNLKNMKNRLNCQYEDSDSSSSDQTEQKYQGSRYNQINFPDHSSNKRKEIDSDSSSKRERKKKSRWGEKVEPAPNTSLKSIDRTHPDILKLAFEICGSANLTEELWKKVEEQYKINLLFNEMMVKRQEAERLAKSGRQVRKYEYDSDEGLGPTWEHKMRQAEMETTKPMADAVTNQGPRRHHIGDFLPPDELKKFMDQYNKKKAGETPSDYQENKLKEDNKGFQMLQKLGWKEGEGLGASGSGIVDPINKPSQRDTNQGLGVNAEAVPDVDDNEYDAYRKRMMLAYRFRPNPLNNPRRAYY